MVTDVTAIEMMPVSVLKLSLLRHVNVPKKENIATTTSYFSCSFPPIRMITTRMILSRFQISPLLIRNLSTKICFIFIQVGSSRDII